MKRKNTLPYAGGKVTLAMAILGMAAGLTITASAAGNEQNQGNKSGKTTVRLGVTKEAPRNVSFEVPLYYTAAIKKTDPDQNGGRKNQVIYPHGYYIKNTSLDNDPQKDNPKELVVAKMEVSSVPGATWNLVDVAPDDGSKNMAVKVGGVPLPAVTAGNTTLFPAKLQDQTSAFYQRNQDGTGTYLVLGDRNGDGMHDDDGKTDLDVEFNISANYEPQGNSATVAQFKVVYTLTTMNADGTLNGLYDQDWVDKDYLGPGKVGAEKPDGTGN